MQQLQYIAVAITQLELIIYMILSYIAALPLFVCFFFKQKHLVGLYTWLTCHFGLFRLLPRRRSEEGRSLRSPRSEGGAAASSARWGGKGSVRWEECVGEAGG